MGEGRALAICNDRAVLQAVVEPLRAGSTYRRAVHLLLGAVLLLPYLGLGVLFVSAAGEASADPVPLVLLLVPAVGAAVGVALVPGVRALEITAARALLGAAIPEPDPRTADGWPARRRAAGWLLVNLVAGGLTAVVVLLAVPTLVSFLVAPWRPVPSLPGGWAAAWAPLLAVALLVLLLHAISVAGAGLARLAPRLLGPSPTERLAAELDRARAAQRALAERTRLARELHDSVGHALTVTTLQAGAAARVLDSDPAFVARALEAIGEAGRAALADLDHVLGLLRAGEDDRTPQPDLGDLDALLAGTRSAGVELTATVDGDVAAVPAAVSREAYRIVQEGLTNALRHAGPVPVELAVRARPDRLELELTNPLPSRTNSLRVGPVHDHHNLVLDGGPARGGRGLAGMRERVAVLDGEVVAGPDGDRWRVAVVLPLPPAGPGRPT